MADGNRLHASSQHPTPEAPSASAQPIARKVLVLYGWDEQVTEKPLIWPVDTMTGELFQAPLEWLGYEVQYLHLLAGPLPSPLPADIAAVLVDGEIDVPPAIEDKVTEWLLSVKAQKRPILFTGSIPISDENALARLASVFGFRGNGETLPRISAVKLITGGDAKALGSETPVTPRRTEFRNLQAPDKAHLFVSMGGVDPDGSPIRYDSVFLAPWGGVWLEPSITLRASADSSLFYIDPYLFLAAWLKPLGTFPAPDTSTRDGRRMFYSHIDGDGFASIAEFKGHPICGELIRDRILKPFPLPVTVSVVEADMLGLAEGLEKENAPMFQEVARSIFQMPNIQAASHTFSHPYIWEARDSNPGIYDTPALPLKPEANYPKMLHEREIRGSIEYINRELLPEGKQCELLLWSGNCRPGPNAIRMVREMGLENLNGGNTIVSRMYPGIAGVAPRVMWWENELQVHASNQNEFMYANGFNGPFFGGFADVIDTFERTESPRRLKPVNLYYHFYSATYLSSLRAVEKICHWVMEQKLHSVTARQFVDITKDSLQTQIQALGPRHWRVSNQGIQRTFRLPTSSGKPDLSLCRNIIGYTTHEDQIYVHTLGEKTAEIVLVDAHTEVPPFPYIKESSAELNWKSFTRGELTFQAKDLRPVEVIVAGLPPGAPGTLVVNGVNSTVQADGNGLIHLPLPEQADVSLRFPPASLHAAH